MAVFLQFIHFGYMDKTFDAFFDLDKYAEIGDAGDMSLNDIADRMAYGNSFPGVFFEPL